MSKPKRQTNDECQREQRCGFGIEAFGFHLNFGFWHLGFAEVDWRYDV
jgi:hypothetical protein